MKKKWLKSNDRARCNMAKLVRGMTNQINAQASSILILEDEYKGQAFCCSPHHMDAEDNVRFMTLDIQNGYPVGICNITSDELIEEGKNSFPIYQSIMKNAMNNPQTVAVYIKCVTEALLSCNEIVHKVLNLYDDIVIAMSFVYECDSYWMYVWFKRDKDVSSWVKASKNRLQNKMEKD